MTPVRARIFRSIAAVVLLAAVTGVGAASAVVVPPGVVGNFEADGNLVVDQSGRLDWANVDVTKVVDDTADSGFQGSSKEEQAADWVCNTGGANPPKGNMLRAYANLQATANPDSAYLHLGYVRESGTGDAHVNFEFNKLDSTEPDSYNGPCPINRSVGDFLVTFDFPGGSDPAEVRAWTWGGSSWTEHTVQAAHAAAATNESSVTDVAHGNAALAARTFGEASIDLLGANIPGVLGCPGTGTVVNIRSRSSHSITSALQDRLPTTRFDLSTCGSVVLHKVDDHVAPAPLAGAVFGLYDNPTATGTPVKTCTSAADGTCTFTAVPPGDYSVKEISAPAGYSPDPSVRTLSVGFRQTVDLAVPFVNPRDTGWLRMVKAVADGGEAVTPPDPAQLDGATFVVYRDLNTNGQMDAGEAAMLWPAETAPGTCTISSGAGYCDVGPLPVGSYRVHESAAPPGTVAGPDVNATVTRGSSTAPVTVTYTNGLPPLHIALLKSGPALAHVGDEITYTFTASTTGPRLHDVELEDLVPTGCTSAITGPTGDDGDGFLETGETWEWTCTRTVTDADGDSILNTARVTGTDDFSRDVSATDDHTVIAIHPAIEVVKTGVDLAHEGDTVAYSFAVTNTGDVALTDIEVTDDVLGDIGTIDSLAAGETVTLTAEFTVPGGAATVDNTATACGFDVLELEVCDDDDHTLTLIHPAIEVVKTGPATATVGDTVAYSFAVTNTGDVALTDIEVTDDVLGAIGTIDSLAAGETVTLTAEFTVPGGAATVDNTATACGFDVLELEVCDDDDHTLAVTVVLGVVEEAQELPRALARTGIDSALQAGLAMLAILAGLVMAALLRSARMTAR